MQTKGKWNIQNLYGVMKTFASAESDDARAWMKNNGDKDQIWNKSTGRWEVNQKTIDRELKKDERERARWAKEDERANKPKKVTKTELDTIYRKVQDAVGESFPDGDPIDHFGGWLRRNGYTMDDVDAAFKKNEKQNFYGYLADYWDEFARGAVADAKSELKNGHTPQHSNFYDVDGDKVTIASNPWKSR